MIRLCKCHNLPMLQVFRNKEHKQIQFKCRIKKNERQRRWRNTTPGGQRSRRRDSLRRACRNRELQIQQREEILNG